MGNIQIKINPSLASMASARQFNSWLTLDCQIDGKGTIGELLARLTREHPDFKRVIFDPETGKVSDEINVVHNQNLLISSEAGEAKVKDGDCILLMPIYTGG
jgi:molybdopterin converting factor small subunit